MSFEKASAWLNERGYGSRIIVPEQSSATVELAAAAIGVQPDEIAKTMSFLLGDSAILILTSGLARTDNRKFKDTFQSGGPGRARPRRGLSVRCQGRPPCVPGRVLEKARHGLPGLRRRPQRRPSGRGRTRVPALRHLGGRLQGPAPGGISARRKSATPTGVLQRSAEQPQKNSSPTGELFYFAVLPDSAVVLSPPRTVRPGFCPALCRF